VGQLPALAVLKLTVSTELGIEEPVQWPPFIPPSPSVHSVLQALPGMLGASGARLDRLEVLVPDHIPSTIFCLRHVAQALRCCSSTIKAFLLATISNVVISCDEDVDDYEDQVEELRVRWTDVLAGVSACRELQLLVLPRIEVEPLFPPGTAFARLTHLEISDYDRAYPPDAGMMGLWELMASGALPALAKLYVRFEGQWEGNEEDVRTRVAPAFEAVAGTLLSLHLETNVDGGWFCEDVGLGYELGVAMGKLRRLKDLAINLSIDGRAYHAMAQGLAASGGDRPLPLLWRVILPREIWVNEDLLASLLLPSVRVFGSRKNNYRRGALLNACAVRQAGYRHILLLDPRWTALKGIVRDIAPCTLGDEIIGFYYTGWCVQI
jgi:hypothetical protein